MPLCDICLNNVIFVSAWLQEKCLDVGFEHEQVPNLNKLLTRFYAEVWDKYGHNSLCSISSHLQQPSHDRTVDILKDKEFSSSNHVFEGYLKQNKLEGRDTTKHKAPLSDSDWEKLQNSPLLSPDTASTLQNNVLINIITHFGRRGREGRRELKKDTFVQHVDDCGRKYYMYV